jgi:ATP-binding cassette subfamily F protein uup
MCIRDRAQAVRGAGADKSASSKPAAAAPAPAAAPATKPRKLSYKDQRELDGLPARIEALEAEQKALSALLADASVYSSDPARAAQAQARHAALDDELLAALERWEALGAKA